MKHNAPDTIDDRLDAVCKRQQARFLDHLRDTRQATPRLETDVSRFIAFVFGDVKAIIRENSQEAEDACAIR